MIFCIDKSRERLRCSCCGSDQVWVQGGVQRTFRTLPVEAKPV